MSEPTRNTPQRGSEHVDLPAAALLTVKQAAKRLAIDEKTVYKYVDDGIIPYVRFRSNIRFRENELLDWIEQHSFRPRPVNSKL